MPMLQLGGERGSGENGIRVNTVYRYLVQVQCPTSWKLCPPCSKGAGLGAGGNSNSMGIAPRCLAPPWVQGTLPTTDASLNPPGLHQTRASLFWPVACNRLLAPNLVTITFGEMELLKLDLQLNKMLIFLLCFKVKKEWMIYF